MLQAGDPLPGGAPEAAGSEDERDRLVVFDELVAEIAVRVEPAYRQADGWQEQTRAGLFELLRFCDEQPDTARAVAIDSIAWGPEVLRRRAQLLDTLAAALDRGCSAEIDPLDVSGPIPDPLPAAAVASGETRHAAKLPGTAENLVGACISLVHTRLLQAEGGRCLELLPSLMSMIVHPYLGPRAAKRELERSLAYVGVGAAKRGPEGPVVGTRERSY
jgi:hypothetical protein